MTGMHDIGELIGLAIDDAAAKPGSPVVLAKASA